MATSRRPEPSPGPPLAQQVARSLDATPALLRYFPELFADLGALGSQPAAIVELVGSLGLPHAARAIDLGCGKGAVTIALAEHLGIAATGVDAFLAFVEEARRQAAEHGVAARCAFVCDDLRRFTGGAERFDLALLIGVGDDASALRAYLVTGERESSLLGDALIAATWVLERAG